MSSLGKQPSSKIREVHSHAKMSSFTDILFWKQHQKVNVFSTKKESDSSIYSFSVLKLRCLT